MPESHCHRTVPPPAVGRHSSLPGSRRRLLDLAAGFLISTKALRRTEWRASVGLSGLKTQRSQNTSVLEHSLLERQICLNKGFGERSARKRYFLLAFRGR